MKLIQCDYNSISSVLKAGRDGVAQPKADLIFADPPYNLGVKYADDDSGDKVDDWSYQQFTMRAIEALRSWARPGATVWWMTPEQHADMTGPILDELIGPRLYRIVWEESFAQYQGSRALTKDYRFIFVHQVPDGPLTWNPDAIRVQSERQRMGDKRANPDGRVPGCVWKVRRLQGTSTDHVDWHPCQLPPELLERVVLGWSNAGDTVLDAFAGSGSMLRVCRRINRRFVGVDKSPTYINNMKRILEA